MSRARDLTSSRNSATIFQKPFGVVHLGLYRLLLPGRAGAAESCIRALPYLATGTTEKHDSKIFRVPDANMDCVRHQQHELQRRYR